MWRRSVALIDSCRTTWRSAFAPGGRRGRGRRSPPRLAHQPSRASRTSNPAVQKGASTPSSRPQGVVVLAELGQQGLLDPEHGVRVDPGIVVGEDVGHEPR